MRPLSRFFNNKATLLLLLIGAANGELCAQSKPAHETPPKTVRLLTIGNSFSHNAVHYLPELAKAAGHTLVLRELIIGGASMERHWLQVQEAAKDPKSPAGLYGTKRSLKQELEAGPWDVVTIQQASIKSHDVSTYRPFAAQLYGFIKQHAPGAEVLLHQTWEYRCDDPRFWPKGPVPESGPVSQQEMYSGLTSAYRTIAQELGVRFIPVGHAFHVADSDYKWGYKVDLNFDAKKAQAPSLPDQTHSLHVGWQWKKQPDGKMKLVMDGHHANMAGEYLGACVWYETLFDEDVTNNTFVPKGLDPEYAQFLRKTAHVAPAESW
jgi:hypothetical protein